MNQDSDGVAEALRGGAQVGLTLAAQAVEIAARQRQAARLEQAQVDQDRAAHHSGRLSAERERVRGQMDRNQYNNAGANEPVEEIWDSPQRRSALEEKLEATAGKEAAAARAVADASQGQPAAKAVAMRPPTSAPAAPRRARPTSAQRVPGAER